MLFYLESEILTYEDMIRIYPDRSKRRPLVLIGIILFYFESCDIPGFFAVASRKIIDHF